MPAFSWSSAKKKICRLIQYPISLQRLSMQLCDLGISKDGILFVHSSLSSIGNLRGGAEGLIHALRAIKAEGTLAMPAHSWKQVNLGSREFSVHQTPSCVGQTCEQFRLQSDTRRSLHPTHSVAAVGAGAEWLIEGHENADSPCGEGTPYHKLVEKSAQILFIGVALNRNTLFHTLETLAKLPCAVSDTEEKFRIEDASGYTYEKYFRLHKQGIARRFADTEALLIERGVAKTGTLQNAKTILLEAAPFAEVIAQELQKKPGFLLDEEPASVPEQA